MPTSLVFLPKEGAPCPDLVSGRPAGGSSRGRGGLDTEPRGRHWLGTGSAATIFWVACVQRAKQL